jgi:integrase
MSNLRELFDIYLDLRPELSAGTIDIYRLALRRLIAATGDNPAEQLTPMQAMTFAASLTRDLAPATANMYLRSIKCWFHWMESAELIQRSPFATIKPFRDRAKGKPVYTVEEIDRLLVYCMDVRWRLIILLAATTGMRRGEILNLTVAEIDYGQGLITLAAKAETAKTWAWDLKDRESRQVPITPAAEHLMLKVHSGLPEGQPYICLDAGRYKRLIRKRDRLAASGQSLPSTDCRCPVVNFRRSFVAICNRAGVKYRSFHALRGSALSCMAQNGLQPHELQAIAGHSKVETTYSHYVRPQEHLERARNAAFLPQNGRYRT